MQVKPGAPELRDWIGRRETATDEVDARQVRAVSAMFDLPPAAAPGQELSGLWYWFYFLPMTPASAIGPDGHPLRGGFLPPVPLERRMWAGSRIKFSGDIRIGDRIKRTSEILDIVEKEGKAGRMVFVTVKHTIASPCGPAIEEEQDIVYLAMPKLFQPPAPVPLPDDLSWREAHALGPVLLFRYSALTFNPHRIHYDRAYAMEVEKYPGLVVQGPLQALALFEAAKARHPARRVAGYSFRGIRPLFDFDTLTLAGRERADGLSLYAANSEGLVTMQASLSWSAS